MYATVAAMLAGGVVFIARPLVRHVDRLSGDIATTAQELTAEPESVQDAALQQRFRLRRAAVAAMRADLLKVVAAESQFVADSGYFTGALPPAYWFEPWRGNTLEGIRLTPRGWWTTIYNLNFSIYCAVAVGPDTSIGDAPSGQPVCFDGNPVGPVPTTREQCQANGYFRWDERRGVCRRFAL